VNDVAVVFGASGLLGAATCERLRLDGASVIPVTRGACPSGEWLSVQDEGWAGELPQGAVTRVVWAQGMNASGSILGGGPEQLAELFEANVGFIVSTLRGLLDRDALAPAARLVVVSSIWQETARADKLAYVTTKSALAGLVRSLVADLGPRGVAVNAVLPGAVDSPMTRSFLSADSIAELEHSTPQRSLVSAADVASACAWLTSEQSRGVNGQFLTVDGGWSSVRHV
jgi:NAD(P)-dependent dehydrogenase (short-subunit alcohol dehydrogenase family)